MHNTQKIQLRTLSLRQHLENLDNIANQVEIRRNQKEQQEEHQDNTWDSHHTCSIGYFSSLFFHTA